jgi:hypothetical protein
VVDHLGQVVHFADTPRYFEDESDEICRSVAHLRISPTAALVDIYVNRAAARKIAVEERIPPTWDAECVVVVGDSAHKA